MPSVSHRTILSQGAAPRLRLCRVPCQERQSTDFNGLPASHPLIFLPDLQVRTFNDLDLWYTFCGSTIIKQNNWAKIGIVAVFVEGKSPTTCNALQQQMLRWWLPYRISLQFQVADAIHLLDSTLPHAWNRSTITPTVAALNKIWLDTVIRQHNEAASVKPMLQVTWTHNSDQAWEYGLTFYRYLGLVGARVRYRLLH